MFINYLESLGYEFVRSYNDYEHPSVKAPSWQRPIRIDKLGAEYTREAIAERLRSNLGKDNLVLSDFQPPDRRRKPLLIILQSYPRYKEPDGFTVFFQVIVDFFNLDAVFFEELCDILGFFDKFGGQIFGIFLFFAVPIHKIHTMFEGRGRDVVKKPSEGLLFVVGKMPDN